MKTKTLLLTSFLGTVIMASSIIWAFVVGNFGQEGSQLISMPWGIVSLVDLYTGFILFSFWIWYREKSKPVAIAWIIAMMILGFLAGSYYVFLHLILAKGNLKRLLLGHHHGLQNPFS